MLRRTTRGAPAIQQFAVVVTQWLYPAFQPGEAAYAELRVLVFAFVRALQLGDVPG